MKVGDKYIATEGFAGNELCADTDEVVTITVRNIQACESLVNAGLLVEVEKITSTKDLQKAIDAGETLELTTIDGKQEFVVPKKNEEETLTPE